MNFTLIVCTYMRPKALLTLLNSVKEQLLYPDEILIIDGSINLETEKVLKNNQFKNLTYHRVNNANRGLTKQRNYGITQVSGASEVICFLDDDIILTPSYFEKLIETYSNYNNALAVGGYITNEVKWKKASKIINDKYFYFDGWMRNEPPRFRLRKRFGLEPDTNPGFLPTFAHGRSTSYLPPSDKVYPVEFFMGGVSSYKKTLFKDLKFSNYFEGYGLYEDLDFCLRASQLGQLYLNTSAKLEHYHEVTGRPNKYIFGKMIVRNSWYVWKVKYKNPNFKMFFKFHITVLLLTGIRFANSFYGSNKKQAITETYGRFVGWLSLFFNKPKIQ